MNYPIRLVLLCALLFSSCEEQLDFFDGDIQDPDLSGEIQGPIGYYSFTTDDLIEELTGSDADIRVDRATDGGISIAYNESFALEDEFSFAAVIEDITILESIASPLASEDAVFGTSNQVTVTNQNIAVLNQYNTPQAITLSETLNFEGNNLSKLDFNNTNLNVVIGSNANTTATIQVTIPSLVEADTNTPLDFSLQVPRQGEVSQTIPLSSYEADFTYDGNNYNQTYNSFVIDAITSLALEVGDVLSKNDVFDIRFEILDIDSNVVYGLFASESQNINIPDIKLDFFDDITIDELSISGAAIDVFVKNSLGVSFDMDVQNSTFTNASGNSQNLVLNESPRRISKASYSASNNAVTPEETVIALNKDTSNLPELLEILPSNLDINIDVETVEEAGFFAFDQSNLEGNVDVVIPIDFKIKGLEFEDVIDLEIDIAEEDTEQFESAELHLNMASNFPLDVAAQLEFLDASGALLEQIKFYDKDGVAFTNNRIDLIRGNANFDATTRKTIGVEEHYLVITIKKESIDQILEINALQLKLEVDTVGDGEVKFFDDYKLDLQVGTSVNLKTN